MDPTQFDDLLRGAIQRRSRRGVLGAVLGGALGAAALAPADDGAARQRKKKPNKPKKCKDGETRCGDKCVDLLTNKKHCGSCGNGCGGNSDNACCGGTCVFINSDPTNCGACGKLCDEKEVCRNRQCQQCPAGWTRCTSPNGDYCADLANDPENCARCGQKCRENEVCQQGGGGAGVACRCPGPDCKLPGGGTRCCPAKEGVCCPGGLCCPAGEVCVPNSNLCCPPDYYKCANKNYCCPNGFTCGGSCGLDCCKPPL